MKASTRSKWNRWVRQLHRWLSIAITVTIGANFALRGLGYWPPPGWVIYSPLLPLALLLVTGLYMFVLPYLRHADAVKRHYEASPLA